MRWLTTRWLGYRLQMLFKVITMNDYEEYMPEEQYTLDDFLDYDPLDSLTEEFGFREELDPETKKLLEQF